MVLEEGVSCKVWSVGGLEQMTRRVHGEVEVFSMVWRGEWGGRWMKSPGLRDWECEPR
jgi:hypothetical protein